MKRQVFFVILMAAALQVYAGEHRHERSSPHYVGGGRYTCNEDTAGCALIKQNNRRITEEEIERAERRSHRYESHARRSDSALTPRKGNELYRSRSSLRDPYDD